MKELELKHIMPYLPYGLSVITDDELESKVSIVDAKNDVLYILNYPYKLDWVKPLLRPMSDLFKSSKTAIKEIIELNDSYDYNNSFTEVYDSNEDYYLDFNNAKTLPYQVVEILFKYHFDVFGLIGKGLAETLKTGL